MTDGNVIKYNSNDDQGEKGKKSYIIYEETMKCCQWIIYNEQSGKQKINLTQYKKDKCKKLNKKKNSEEQKYKQLKRKLLKEKKNMS